MPNAVGWGSCPERTLIRDGVLTGDMGIFTDVGRKFEETKQSLIDSDQPAYVCHSCEKSVNKNTEYCPHCGEDTVEPVS